MGKVIAVVLSMPRTPSRADAYLSKVTLGLIVQQEIAEWSARKQSCHPSLAAKTYGAGNKKMPYAD